MAGKFLMYGVEWQPHTDPVHREIEMIRHGGRWRKKIDGEMAGEGLVFHFRELVKLIWPWVKFHKWLDLFIESYLEYRTIGCLGPASCLAGDSQIFDAELGNITIQDLAESRRAPLVMTVNGPVRARIPFLKGTAALYEVRLENGMSFKATLTHRVRSLGEFVHVGSLEIGQYLDVCDPDQLASISALDPLTRVAGVNRSLRTIEDSQSDYRASFHSCDGQLHCGLSSDQGVAPSQFDAPIYNRSSSDTDVSRFSKGHSRTCRKFSRPSIDDFCGGEGCKEIGGSLRGSSNNQLLCAELFQLLWQFQKDNSPHCSFSLPSRDCCDRLLEPSARRYYGSETLEHNLLLCRCASQSHEDSNRFCTDIKPRSHSLSRPIGRVSLEPMIQRARVTSIKFTGTQGFYDMQVPNEHHYIAQGTIHHNSGKTFDAALCGLTDWYCFPGETTVLCCSTTRERLEDRIWGEIKRLHKSAQEHVPWLPGALIEGRQRLLRDPKLSASEGRDFRNGLAGVACRVGGNFVGLGDFIGIKNKRVRLIGDEIHLLPRVWVDAISNLDKNKDFKAVGLGNPKDTTDALGVFCEPAADLGGWEGGIDQQPGTKSWRTKRTQGICLQFPGTDSPNLDGQLGIPLITQEQMDRDISFYGKDSLWYTMMNLGSMPRGQGARRVLTRQMCLKFQALEEPNWAGSNRTRIAALDAAYRGVGGDRCILVFMEFGDEVAPLDPNRVITNLLSQAPNTDRSRKIIALTEVLLVPISGIMDPEDQIVKFTMEQCGNHNVPSQNFFYDSGMRTSLVQAFARLWATTTNSVDCGGAPSDRYVSEDIQVAAKDYYSKKITELWFAVRHIVEARQFRGMTDEVMGEFIAREWTMVGANKIEVEPKEKMKLKTSRSPDLADAVVIGCHGAVQRGFKIMRLGEDRRGPNSDRWKRDLRARASKLHQSGNLKYAA